MNSRSLCLLFCVGLAALPAGAGASIGDRIQSTQASIESMHRRLAQKRRLLEFQRLRALDLQHQLDATNQGISRVTATLGELSGQVRVTEKRLAWNKRQLDAARATLERHNAALNRRLVDAYERGDVGYINVLFSATSFGDFVERWDDIRFLIAADQKTVRERRSAERSVSEAEARLERERSSLAASLGAEQQTKYQLAALATQRSGLVSFAESQRRHVAQEIAALEELTANQEAALEALIRERQRIEAARRAALAEARRRAAQLAGGQAPPPANEGAPAQFSWPVGGPITSPFGMRADPLGRGFRKHSGIDIGAPMGATITAPAGGRVIYSGWYGGYGNALIIDHGGATSTLYGHCSQLFVAEGQDVQRGQAIAAVGSTGNSTGPHLHFEIRINGVPVDPVTRLR